MIILAKNRILSGLICVLLALAGRGLDAQVWRMDSVGILPEPVTNSAVIAATVEDTPYIYTFGGLDSSKKYSGIHLKSWRYNTLSGRVERLEDVPDGRGKIAMAASKVDSIIYIIGGYHVYASGREKSSAKMHRFNLKSNHFIQDGPDLLYPIDDHVQVVYKNRYIYVITGWMNTHNVPFVQIYDPETNQWTEGTKLPNTQSYKAFGASGCVVGDTIYYLGGASDQGRFEIRRFLRKGVIDSQNNQRIRWSTSEVMDFGGTYRAASACVGGIPTWIGGSGQTYNYDGISYAGHRGVPPLQLIYEKRKAEGEAFRSVELKGLPMDLRGIGLVNDSTLYVLGGMGEAQKVRRQILRLRLMQPTGTANTTAKPQGGIKIYPNPSCSRLRIFTGKVGGGRMPYIVYRLTGKELLKGKTARDGSILMDGLPEGIYLLKTPQGIGRFVIRH